MQKVYVLYECFHCKDFGSASGRPSVHLTIAKRWISTNIFWKFWKYRFGQIAIDKISLENLFGSQILSLPPIQNDLNFNDIWPNVLNFNNGWSNDLNFNDVWSNPVNLNDIWPNAHNFNDVWPNGLNFNDVWPNALGSNVVGPNV